MRYFSGKPAVSKFIIIFFSSAFLLACDMIAEQDNSGTGNENELITGLNAYSFSDLLYARDSRENNQVYTLFNLLDWCSDKNIKAIDPTGYFFPTYPEPPSDEYLNKFKNRAAELGIVISGTGIRNNFASPDPEIRAQGVELAKEWIVVASKLGAPVLRVFAGKIPEGYENNWEVPAGWMIECYKELIPVAEKNNIKLGIQNHGDMLQTADQCLYILERLDSENVGIIIDIGSFTSDDIYEDIKTLIPYAVNWQIKEFTDGKTKSQRTDYVRLIKILKEESYKGILPIETLKVPGELYDPFQKVIEMKNDLDSAIHLVYH